MRIVFICHPSAGRHWSPADAADGIGGSEEAVIGLSATLAHRGHEVSVHMRTAPSTRHRAVLWSNWDAVPRDRIDVVVVWRRPSLIDHVEARVATIGRTYLWLHDLTAESTVNAYLDRYHKVIVLSQFHRRQYPSVPDDRIAVIENGIAAADFAPPNPWRDPNLIAYGSDYQRGLLPLLESWPRIRADVPNARLNVFYGWAGVEYANPARAQHLKSALAPLFRQDGVRHLGRIGHPAVAHQFRTAGVWAYPCSFPETSCITAMKAQAGGAIPAVITTGALAETVRFGCRIAKPDPATASSEPSIIERWRKELVELLGAPERQRRIRRTMMPQTRRRFSWTVVAERWERELMSTAGDRRHDTESYLNGESPWRQ